jgi:hypothetical protein
LRITNHRREEEPFYPAPDADRNSARGALAAGLWPDLSFSILEGTAVIRGPGEAIVRALMTTVLPPGCLLIAFLGVLAFAALGFLYLLIPGSPR